MSEVHTDQGLVYQYPVKQVVLIASYAILIIILLVVAMVTFGIFYYSALLYLKNNGFYHSNTNKMRIEII